MKKPQLYSVIIFIFSVLLVHVSNLTGAQDALAGKTTTEATSAELLPEDEANLIEHLDELEAWDLIENMELLQNLEFLENIEIKSSTIKGS